MCHGCNHGSNKIEKAPGIAWQGVAQVRWQLLQSFMVTGARHTHQVPLLLRGHQPTASSTPQTAVRADAAALVPHAHNAVQGLGPEYQLSAVGSAPKIEEEAARISVPSLQQQLENIMHWLHTG